MDSLRRRDAYRSSRHESAAECTELLRVSNHAESERVVRNTYIKHVHGSRLNNGPCTQARSGTTCFVLNHADLNLSNHCA